MAVDHFNTGHPHSHVVIRGKDDLGKDLIIAQDYITDGVRLRAQQRVTLELGPETGLELRQKLTAEVTADRFTRIDRAMLEEAPDRVLDLRPEAGQVRADFDRTLRIGRLQALGRMGLAREAAPGVWTLSERLEPTLRELGERGDIIKAMNRALSRRGQERDPMSYRVHGTAPAEPVVGRVIGKGLTDELSDRIGLVIDGTDGRERLRVPARALATGDRSPARARGDGHHARGRRHRVDDRPRARDRHLTASGAASSGPDRRRPVKAALAAPPLRGLAALTARPRPGGLAAMR